jgi:hypothetical protein
VIATGCVVTGGIGSEGAFVHWSSSLSFACSDLWGNEGGDWIGPIAGQLGQDGNISADPRYCDAAGDDFTVADDSPCVVGLDPGCDPMGALGVGCSGTTDAPPVALGGPRLEPNRPNPFNPVTTIPFWMPTAGRARIGVYALDGRLVAALIDDEIAAGAHQVAWRGSDTVGRAAPAGVYVVRLEVGGTTVSQRMAMVR